MKRRYVCAECGEPVQSSAKDTKIEHGRTLGTFACPRHPRRKATVSVDESGGHEDGGAKMRRETPVSKVRHTRVAVVMVKE